MNYKGMRKFGCDLQAFPDLSYFRLTRVQKRNKKSEITTFLKTATNLSLRKLKTQLEVTKNTTGR